MNSTYVYLVARFMCMRQCQSPGALGKPVCVIETSMCSNKQLFKLDKDTTTRVCHVRMYVELEQSRQLLEMV